MLGPVAAFDEQGAVVPVVGRRQERLLCALLAASPHAVSADRLIEAVWPNDPPSGPGPLRTVASRLRSSLGGLIVSRGTGYAIEGCSIDSGGFEALSARSREALPLEATRLLDEALGLWRGRPFEELADVDWVQPLAVRLNELRCEAVERQAEALIELCELGSAAAVLEAHCISEPLRERPHGLLMTAYARDGRAADARRASLSRRFRPCFRHERPARRGRGVQPLVAAPGSLA